MEYIFLNTTGVRFRVQLGFGVIFLIHSLHQIDSQILSNNLKILKLAQRMRS